MGYIRDWNAKALVEQGFFHKNERERKTAMNRIVYADNAATTAVSTQVLEAMLPYYKEVYGNPSSLYAAGQKAKAALDQARADVAACLGADQRGAPAWGLGR